MKEAVRFFPFLSLKTANIIFAVGKEAGSKEMQPLAFFLFSYTGINRAQAGLVKPILQLLTAKCAL